jgi:ribosomal protein L7/L12
MNITMKEFNEVLDVLLRDDYDHRGMIEKIARTNPRAILDVMSENEIRFPELHQHCLDCHKIQAIKHVRQISGMGLRESKEYVEEYIAMNKIGKES